MVSKRNRDKQIRELRSFPSCRNSWGVCFGSASRRCPSSPDVRSPHRDMLPFQMARRFVPQTLDGCPTGVDGGRGPRSTARRIESTCSVGWAHGRDSLESGQAQASRPEGKLSGSASYLRLVFRARPDLGPGTGGGATGVLASACGSCGGRNGSSSFWVEIGASTSGTGAKLELTLATL